MSLNSALSDERAVSPATFLDTHTLGAPPKTAAARKGGRESWSALWLPPTQSRERNPTPPGREKRKEEERATLSREPAAKNLGRGKKKFQTSWFEGEQRKVRVAGHTHGPFPAIDV